MSEQGIKTSLKPLMSSEKMDWETPDSTFAPLNEEFNFDIDLAASAENTKCKDYFDESANSLTQSWYGKRGWLNPPYGRDLLPKFIQKAYEETRNEHTLVVMLIPARTDTSYWHDYVMKAEKIGFIRGRIKFVGAKHGAPFPSAIVIFGVKNK